MKNIHLKYTLKPMKDVKHVKLNGLHLKLFKRSKRRKMCLLANRTIQTLS